ncbi:MAG: hypothetical protein HY882_04140 [Deltaproteobacteria bacterium]|nr:hypothetical protein [Deltaproteobacteria bacterium]
MLLKNYTYRAFPPDCSRSSSKLNAIAELDEDISEIFPYLNGVMKDCVYTPEAKTLSFKKDGHLITLQPRQIALTKLNDQDEAEKVFTGSKS